MSLILALVACLVSAPQLATTVRAGQSPAGGGGTEPDPDTPDKGDPDLPVGSARTVRFGPQRGGSTSLKSRDAGDASAARSDWMWRIRVALKGLRTYYLRF